MLNVGAISQNGTSAHVTMSATGTPKPLASIINYNPAGPVADMATVPHNSSVQFAGETQKSVHLFADVAGFYVKPLYTSIDPNGAIYQGTASGVVSSARTATGHYTVTFNRDVQRCAASGTAIQWFGVQEVSVDTAALERQRRRVRDPGPDEHRGGLLGAHRPHLLTSAYSRPMPEPSPSHQNRSVAKVKVAGVAHRRDNTQQMLDGQPGLPRILP